MDIQTTPPAIVQPERQPYSPPRLIVHGTVAVVTAGSFGGTQDGKGGSDPFP